MPPASEHRDPFDDWLSLAFAIRVPGSIAI